MPQPQIIKTPKTYWAVKRREGHRDWRMAFWRELFQNAVDAGAGRIDISLDEAAGIGSWERAPNDETVTRVVFSDNGRGMNRETMETVFFAPGESTKRGDGANVGGFGTARTMLCFSQSRFSIRTGNILVEGDGSEYTIDDVPGVARKGAAFEIDVPPFENGVYNTVERMRERLNQYVSYSQLAPKVFVNGEEMKPGTKKGAATCRLFAEIDGREVEFATVHANRGERSPHKGKIIVRVHGAAMFTEEADVPFQVVVEVDPSMSRTVLLDNRDGMKWEYSRALTRFMEELNKDVRSALDKDELRKHTVVRGGLGDMVQAAITKLRGANWSMPFGDVATAAEAVPTSALHYLTPEIYEVQGFGGVPAPAIGAFLDQVKDGTSTFLDGWADRAEVDAFITAVREDGSAALGVVSPEFAAFVAAGVGLVAEREGVTGLMKDSHDIHIHREGLVEGEKGSDDNKLFHAARRWSPVFWRKANHDKGSRGSGAHITLAAWTACCQHAVAYLARMAPHAVPEGGMLFSTGYAFVKARDTWNYDLGRTVQSRVGALYKRIDETHALLLNPVMNNGEAVYDLTVEGGDPSSPVKGIADMMALAWHEATHILRGPHDEEYASLLTKMMAGFARQDIQRGMRDSMREAINATRAAYGRGECRIQALEPPAPAFTATNPQEARPAERLLTLANPAITLVLGTVIAPDNNEAAVAEMPELLAYIDQRIAHEKATADAPVVTRVDCEGLSTLEAGIARILLGKEPVPVALVPVDVAPENQPHLNEVAKAFEVTEENPIVGGEVVGGPVIGGPGVVGAPKIVNLTALDIGRQKIVDLSVLDIGGQVVGGPVISGPGVAGAPGNVDLSALDIGGQVVGGPVISGPGVAGTPGIVDLSALDIGRQVLADVPGTVDLSALDIGSKAQLKERPEPAKVTGADPSQLLAVLGQGQGRFSAPVVQGPPKGDTPAVSSTPRERIELAQGGLAGLIRRGGLAGLALRIKTAAGDTSSFPEPVIELQVEENQAEAALVGEELDMLDDEPPAVPAP